MLRALACLALLVAWGANAAPAEPSRVDSLAGYQRDLVSILVLRGDAQHLLGAALLARPLTDLPQGFDADYLLARAAEGEGRGTEVLWMRLATCAEAESDCSKSELLAKLEAEAADNAAVWLIAFGDARKRDDADAAEAAFAHAVAATRYDDYAGAALGALALAATALPVPEATRAAYAGKTDAGATSVQAFIAFGLAATHPRPALAPLVAYCTDQPTRDADCRKLARTLTWGSSAEARAAGLRIMQRTAEDDAARDSAQADLEDLAWQVENLGRITLRAMTDAELASRMLRLAARAASEASFMSALLHQQDVPLEAPARPRANEAQPATSAGEPGDD